jgi:hypothetical protein
LPTKTFTHASTLDVRLRDNGWLGFDIGLHSFGSMSWHLKRSLWTATLERYPTSFKEDRDRSSSLSRRPTRPFLRRPSTNGVTLQTLQPGSGATVANLAICAIPEHPRVTRTRSRSSDALIPWRQPRRHSFSGSHAPGIQAIHHALPLFTAPRGSQRGAGISTSLIPMEIPDLSLRSTFAPPHYKDHKPPAKCTMCKCTIYNLECGHPVEDHVATGDCAHYEKTGVPCDRENPANRDRVSVRSEDRDGLCNKCRRLRRDMSELEAMNLEEEPAKQQSLAEADGEKAAFKEHEEKLYKDAREEFTRLQQEREQADTNYMLQKSREEAEALREQDELVRALKTSFVLSPADRNITYDEKVSFQTAFQVFKSN